MIKRVLRKSRRAAVKDGLKWALIMILDKLGRQHIEEGRKRMAVFSFDYVSNFINVNGIYEGEDLDILFDYILSSDFKISDGLAIDIGANIGNHALYFSRYFRKVACFEANPIVLSVLSINAKLVDNVVVHHVALSDHVGEGVLRFDPANLGSGSLFDPGASSVANIPLATLDSYADELQDVRLIKLDVQGAEESVLRGGRDLIRKAMPIVLFEQIPRDIENETSVCVELLKSYGYNTFMTIDTHLFRPINIKNSLSIISDIVFDFIKPPIRTITRVQSFQKKIYPFVIAVPDKNLI